MATILDHPKAQALLDEATVSPDQVRDLAQRLTPFLQRYLPLFQRAEQQRHASTLLHGKLSALPRKTTEPIARHARQHRRPLQHFVGAGLWSDDLLRHELAHHVRQEIGDPKAVLALDGHGNPKKGDDSCGVARQWCGRLGKVDNCQQGYFLGYLAPQGRALIGARLYLPQERANDKSHRRKTHVPKEVKFQEGWRLALELLQTYRHD